MINLHKLSNGDVIKFLPFVSDNNEFTWIHTVDALVYFDKRIHKVFDLEGKWVKNFLTKNQNFDQIKARYNRCHYCQVLIDDEVKVITFGRTLYNIITTHPDLFKLESNSHLLIQIEEKQGLQIFDKSIVIDAFWQDAPVDYINSLSEWSNFIKNKQSDITNYFESNNLTKHRQRLIDIY